MQQKVCVMFSCLPDLQVQARYDSLKKEHQLLEPRHSDYVFSTAVVSDSQEDIETVQDNLAEMEAEFSAVKADHNNYWERNRHLVIENVSFDTSHSLILAWKS